MPKARIRPDPVSCQSCRTKKLKCNRVQPCSNCIARGITCNFLIPPERQTRSNSGAVDNSEFLERIERLEALVLQLSHPETSTNAPAEVHLANSLARRRSVEELTVSPASQCNHNSSAAESQLLENVGTTEDSLLPGLSEGLIFRIQDTLSLTEHSRHSSSPTQPGRSAGIVVVFPTYTTAALLLQSYESKVDHLCRIVHLPTIRTVLRKFYLKLGQNEALPPGQAALLLSIFAIAAFFSGSDIASSQQEIVDLTRNLTKGALDVIQHSCRTTSSTLEDVQAHVLISLTINHLEGLSATSRLLSAAAISIARDLRLHRLDAEDSQPEKPRSGRDMIDREMKRRVFWYIASQDWLSSAISGPQEGTYFIHPNHINVKLPKDCTDEDIILGEEDDTATDPQPTGMTFLLARIRLAHIYRELADTLPLEPSKLYSMPYETILALDQKLKTYITSLPFIFQLDASSRQKSKPLETIYPMIPVWRYCLITAVHSRRCKLHQKFLLRQAQHPGYVYSRRACLDSARTVIQVYQDINKVQCPATLMARMCMAVHFTHLALAVLVMDFCFNRELVDEPQTRAEVKAALRVFEDARGVAPLLDRHLNLLNGLLRKHKIYLTDQVVPEQPQAQTADFAPGSEMESFGSLHGDHTAFPQIGNDGYDPSVFLGDSFEDFWQIPWRSELNLDSLTWDHLFSSLDSQQI